MKKQTSLVSKNNTLVQNLKHLASEQQDVVTRLVEAIKDKGSKKETIELLGKLEGFGLKNSTLSRFNSIALGQVFKVFKQNWDALPEEFTSSYTDYYSYIQEKYGYGGQMADMYAEVWEAFFSGDHITERDIPSFVDISKLPVAKMSTASSYILRGEMTRNRWKALATSTFSRSQLSAALRQDDPEPSVEGYIKSTRGRKKSNMKIVFLERSGDIRAYMPDGSIEQVGFLNISSSNPLILRLIRGFLKLCNISIVTS